MTVAQFAQAIARAQIALLRLLLPLIRTALRGTGPSDEQITRLARRITPLIRRARRTAAESTWTFMDSAARAAGYDESFKAPVGGYSEQAVSTVLKDARTRLQAGERAPQVQRRALATFGRHVGSVQHQIVHDSLEPVDGEFSWEDKARSEAADVREIREERWARRLEQSKARSARVERARVARNERRVAEAVALLERDQRAAAAARTKRMPRPVAYARGVQGETCGFCTMLASRGAVYRDEMSASFEPHDGCDCVAIPVFTSKNYLVKDQADDLYQLWLSVTDGFTGVDKLNAWRREVDLRARAGIPLIGNFTNNKQLLDEWLASQGYVLAA